MFSKPLAVGLLAAGCVTAAAGGAYVAVRQTAAQPGATSAAPVVPAPVATAAERPVAETEAFVAPPAATPASTPTEAGAPARRPAATPPRQRTQRETRRRSAPIARTEPPAATATVASPAAVEAPPAPADVVPPSPPAVPPTAAVELPDTLRVEVPADPPARTFEELVVPAASVIGLQVDSAISSEHARVEDRVDARVTRDVVVDGRTAIPAGSRALGAVTVVERGGKVKERARLGVRFHTLVLADGTRLPIRTDAIFREGDSPTGESARKIGGAAVGGAIIGAIIGGKKGAVVGGATGAAGGTAVVMAGGRNAATLPAGTIVTVRLSAPVVMEVEKQPQ